MSLTSSIGVGYSGDSFAAGAFACQDAIARLGTGVKANALIVFSSSKYDQEQMLKGVRSVNSDALLVGSSTAGEISTEGPVGRSSVVVMALSSEGIKFFAGVGDPVSKGPHNAGKTVAEEVKKQAGEELKTFIMLPDVLNGNGAETVRGVLETLGEHFPVVGCVR